MHDLKKECTASIIILSRIFFSPITIHKYKHRYTRSAKVNIPDQLYGNYGLQCTIKNNVWPVEGLSQLYIYSHLCFRTQLSRIIFHNYKQVCYAVQQSTSLTDYTEGTASVFYQKLSRAQENLLFKKKILKSDVRPVSMVRFVKHLLIRFFQNNSHQYISELQKCKHFRNYDIIPPH